MRRRSRRRTVPGRRRARSRSSPASRPARTSGTAGAEVPGAGRRQRRDGASRGCWRRSRSARPGRAVPPCRCAGPSPCTALHPAGERVAPHGRACRRDRHRDRCPPRRTRAGQRRAAATARMPEPVPMSNATAHPLPAAGQPVEGEQAAPRRSRGARSRMAAPASTHEREAPAGRGARVRAVDREAAHREGAGTRQGSGRAQSAAGTRPGGPCAS